MPSQNPTKLTRQALIATRDNLRLTQDGMAKRLGMALRSYQAIEQGESKFRLIHFLAIERVALAVAAETRDFELLPDSVRKDAVATVRASLKDKPSNEERRT